MNAQHTPGPWKVRRTTLALVMRDGNTGRRYSMFESQKLAA